MLPNRRTLADNYDLISWVMRIFLGGAFNIILLNALSIFVGEHVTYESTTNTYYFGNLISPSSLPQFVVLLMIVLVSPLLASLLLTKRDPELRIVPPFYVAIFGLCWILIFWIAPLHYTRVLFSAILGVVLVLTGRFEDRVVTSIVGIATDRKYIYFEQLRIFAQIEEIKARFSIPEIMDNLILSDKVEGDETQGYMLRTEGGYDVVTKIQLLKDKQFPDTPVTNVKIVYYYKKSYNLQFSPTFLEYCRRTSRYIEDIFLNRDRGIVMPLEIIVALTNNVRDPLVDSIIDELMGYYAKSRRLSTPDKIKIAAVLAIAAITAGLFVFNEPLLAEAAIIVDALFALAELPDILRRQR